MNSQTGNGNVDRPLRRNEVRIFSAENFAGTKQILAVGEVPAFPAAGIQVGPQTGVTLFAGADCTGQAQELLEDLASFAGSRLQGQPAESLSIWASDRRKFRGYWAIEARPGYFLTVGPGGVLATSEYVTESAAFRIPEAGALQGAVTLTPRGMQPEAVFGAVAAGGFLTAADLHNVALQEEPGKRQFSLLSADNRYFAYQAGEDRFTLTDSPEARAVFAQAIRIADDETQLAPLARGEVALYENPAYWGKAWVFDTDFADFGKVVDLNEAVSSIQLGPLTGVTIYRAPDMNQEDKQAAKQDVISSLPDLAKEQVGEDQISSMDVWRIVAPESQGLTFQSKLIQDFRGEGAAFQEFSAYRTTLRLPALVENVEIWATDETDITVNGTPYHVTEDQSISAPPNKLGRLIVTSDAIGVTNGEPARGCLKSPGLKFRTDAMPADQRIVIYPDRVVHERLAGLAPDALWNATFVDEKKAAHPLIRDRDPKKQADVAAAQSMITRVMSTVKYTGGAGGFDQTISGDGLEGKSWGLDFSTCRVNVRTLFVREGPGLKFAKKGFLKYHDIVQIMGYNVAGDWIHIRRPSDGFEGWSYGMYLGKIGRKAIEEAQYRVKANILNIREGPGTDFPILGAVQRGALVTAFAMGEQADWTWVRSKDGENAGWCYARYLELDPSADISFGAGEAPAALPPNPQPPAIPGLTPNVRFHEVSDADVQALLARAVPGEGALSFGLLEDLGSAFQSVFNEVKTAVSVVITACEDTWQMIINLGDQVVKWVVDTVDKAIACVEGIIEKIGAVIEEVVKWLRFVFDWDAILATRAYLVRNINILLDYLATTLNAAETPVRNFFTEKRQAINKQINQLITDLGGTPTLVSSQPPANTGDGLEIVDWLLAKITEAGSAVTGASSFLDVDYPAKADETLLPFWKGVLASIFETLSAGPEGIANAIASLVHNPDQPQLAVAALLNMIARQVDGVLGLGENMAVGLLALASDLVKQVKIMLNANLRIPFISDLIEWIGKLQGQDVDASLGFSILDATTLIMAIPVTILAKVVLGKAPFECVADLVPPEYPWQTPSAAVSFDPPAGGAVVDGFTITSGIAGYLTGLLSIPLDMTPEGDESLSAGLSGFLEVASFLCNFAAVGFDRGPNLGPACTTGKDREGTNADGLWWTLAGIDGGMILLDIASLIYGWKENKPERLRRANTITIWISTGIGAIYLGLLGWKTAQDQEAFLDALPDLLMAFPGICPFLRLFQNPFTSLAFGIVDGVAAETALVKGLIG
jgi:hypothetical protein